MTHSEQLALLYASSALARNTYNPLNQADTRVSLHRSNIQERKAAEELAASARLQAAAAQVWRAAELYWRLEARLLPTPCLQRDAEAAVAAEQRMLSTILEQLPSMTGALVLAVVLVDGRLPCALQSALL